MKCIRAVAPMGALLLLSACQHIAPAPLNLGGGMNPLPEHMFRAEPVKSYAAALAERRGEEEPAAFDARDGLTLHEAEAVALQYNTDLRLARLEADKAAAIARAAGRMVDPEAGIEVGQKELEGISRDWISGASLSITLPLSGRRGAERALRGTEHRVAMLAVAEEEWKTLHALRDAWLRWSAVEERVRLLDAHLALMGTYRETAEALAQVGEMNPSSARLFSIEHGRAQAERMRAAAEAGAMQIHINQLLGLLPDAPVALLPALVLDEEVAGLATAEHPRVARAREEYQAAEDKLRLELRRQYPDLMLSPSYMNETDETSLVLGLGMPLPVWNANRAGIAEAAGERDIARARAETEYQEVLSEEAQAWAIMAGARARRAQLAEVVAPAVDAQLQETQALLEAGELDVALVFETMRQALETKVELLEAHLEEQLALSRVLAATAVNWEGDDEDE